MSVTTQTVLLIEQKQRTYWVHIALLVACGLLCQGKVWCQDLDRYHGATNAESMLQQAQLMSNADELCLFSDRIFAGADTLATAEVLKAGVQKMHGKMDIVFSGHRASDGETGQTGPQTAWKLGMTFLGT